MQFLNRTLLSEFKQNAVKLAVESDQSVAKTAKDLGVNANTLYTWITVASRVIIFQRRVMLCSAPSTCSEGC